MKICVSPNEDGFGPSAFAYYLVCSLIETWKMGGRQGQLDILVLNENARQLNQSLYRSIPEVRLAHLSSLIKLEKRHGEVHAADTLAHLRGYVEGRRRYVREVQPHLADCSLTLDIGVPFLAGSARESGVKNITLFDHSWACTLRGVCSPEAEYDYNPVPTDRDRDLAERIAAEIEKDEKCTSHVFLFDRYITPPEFRRHWETLGFAPKILSGVLGSRQDPVLARQTLNGMFAALGQKPVSAEDELILISPGGTPVWDELLPKMVEDYAAQSAKPYVPVLSHPNLGETHKSRARQSGGIRWFELVPGATQQAVIPAFALVVTRAGGGMVNDCLAGGTTFVCVEEHQWQAELIERECRALRLIPALRETSLREFRRDPVGCIDVFFAACRDLPATRTHGGAEKDVAAFILSML